MIVSKTFPGTISKYVNDADNECMKYSLIGMNPVYKIFERNVRSQVI